MFNIVSLSSDYYYLVIVLLVMFAVNQYRIGRLKIRSNTVEEAGRAGKCEGKPRLRGRFEFIMNPIPMCSGIRIIYFFLCELPLTELSRTPWKLCPNMKFGRDARVFGNSSMWLP